MHLLGFELASPELQCQRFNPTANLRRHCAQLLLLLLLFKTNFTLSEETVN